MKDVTFDKRLPGFSPSVALQEGDYARLRQYKPDGVKATASLSSDLDAFEPGRDRVRRAPRLADRVRSRVTAGVDDRRAPSLDDRSPTASAAFPEKRARRCALPMKHSPWIPVD